MKNINKKINCTSKHNGHHCFAQNFWYNILQTVYGRDIILNIAKVYIMVGFIISVIVFIKKNPRPISLQPIIPKNFAAFDSKILLQSLFLNNEHILSA